MNSKPTIQLLIAIWHLWQTLAADGAAQLRQACQLELRGFIALGYLQGTSSTPAHLAHETQMPRYEVSRLLKELEQQGYIQRVRNHSDGRQVHVEITPAGRAAWEKGLVTVEQVAKPYLSGLDDATLSQLILTLSTLTHSRP